MRAGVPGGANGRVDRHSIQQTELRQVKDGVVLFCTGKQDEVIQHLRQPDRGQRSVPGL